MRTAENVTDLAHTSSNGPGSLRASALLLGLALTVISAIVAAVNFSRYGDAGLVAALTASLLVSTGMFAALWITSLGAGRAVIHYGLGAQLVRLAAPAVGALGLQFAFPALAEAGVFGCVLAIYLPALLIETWLAVRMLNQAAGRVRHG